MPTVAFCNSFNSLDIFIHQQAKERMIVRLKEETSSFFPMKRRDQKLSQLATRFPFLQKRSSAVGFLPCLGGLSICPGVDEVGSRK
jgi:hypothetical protein